jgi:glycosyltransferase involved in cell wall biosynthesis
MATLALYTNSFPYGTAETFLETEISFLAEAFEKIYIIPRVAGGIARQLPVNVSVRGPVTDVEWSTMRIYREGLFRSLNLFTVPGLLKGFIRSFSPRNFKYLGYGFLTKKHLSGLIPDDADLHYSYWFDYTAFALCLLKREGRITAVAGRAHGFDLYEERGEKGLTFIKPAIIRGIDSISLISEHGRNYLLKKFPINPEKFKVFRLGTKDPEAVNPLSDEAFLTFVSCSAINPNKRIELIFDSLKCFRDKFPGKKITWYHIGSGKDLNKLKDEAGKCFAGSELKVNFMGQMTSNGISEFYMTVPVDLFLNVSISEGISVSIMEAMSYSVPVAATAVGGTPEIVNNENGMLLSPVISPEELSDIFAGVFEQRSEWKEKRATARETWFTNFNADKNYRSFAGDLIRITGKKN